MRTQSGFTLIELLVVVGIIAILAAIALPNFLEAQIRSKVSRTKSDLRTTAVGLESYAVDHNTYPPSFDLTRLSTPLAYLSSGSTPDIFDQNGARPLGYVQGREAGTTEFLEDFDVTGSTPGERASIASHGWFLYSNGPDTVNDALQSPMETFQDVVGRPGATGGSFYDPTNGTVSRGDIIRSPRLKN